MPESTDALIRDLVEWIAITPRTHADVMDAWRTSCPRLTIWEDALDLGYVTRDGQNVTVTERGHAFVRDFSASAAA